MEPLKGKKTFLAAGLAIVGTCFTWASQGEFTLVSAGQLYNEILLPLLAVTLRLGIRDKTK